METMKNPLRLVTGVDLRAKRLEMEKQISRRRRGGSKADSIGRVGRKEIILDTKGLIGYHRRKGGDNS